MSPTLSVPEGYKQTEVGVIPEQWTPTTIGQVVSFSEPIPTQVPRIHNE